MLNAKRYDVLAPMSSTNGSHLSCGSFAEGPSEEPGDEGSDGSDEEPAVGRQRHADAQEMINLHRIHSRFKRGVIDYIVAKSRRTKGISVGFLISDLNPQLCYTHSVCWHSITATHKISCDLLVLFQLLRGKLLMT